MNKNILTSLVVFVVLLGAGAAVYYKTGGDFSALGIDNSTGPQVASSTMATSSEVRDLGNGVSVTGAGNATIEQVSATGVQRPSLTREVHYSSSLDSAVFANLKLKIASTTTGLKVMPGDGQLWLALGLYYKMAGDYKAAEEVWVYLAKVLPDSVVPHNNLGDLYQNFLHNYAKAEVEYKAVIKINPAYIDAYRNLSIMYRGQYKVGTSAAADIIAQGLKANPNNADLLQLQKQL